MTLVFNDGRPQEQICNYVLTSSALYILDQGWREVPITQIDVASTQKVSRQAGVEFGLGDNSEP